MTSRPLRYFANAWLADAVVGADEPVNMIAAMPRRPGSRSSCAFGQCRANVSPYAGLGCCRIDEINAGSLSC